MQPQEHEKEKECGHIVDASFVIQREEKEATRSVANKFEVSKISDKDGIEIPLRSTELAEQEKQRKSEVALNKNIENLGLESYSKNELIKIIECSLLSYVEGLKEAKVIENDDIRDESRIHVLKVKKEYIRTRSTFPIIILSYLTYKILKSSSKS